MIERHAARLATGATLVVLALAAAGCGSSSTTPEATPPVAPVVAPEQRCVDRWNRLAARVWPSGKPPVIGKYFSVELIDLFKNYVSVGFSADYPDRCLITASNPDKGLASQWFETPGGRLPFRRVDLNPEALDPSTTNWNARVVQTGCPLYAPCGRIVLTG